MVIVGAVFIVLMVITALVGGPDNDDETAEQQIDTQADVTTTTTELTAGEVTVSTTPRPSLGEATSLEAELAAIYPGVPEGKYTDWSVSVCSDLLRGITGAELEGNLIYRFSGGTRPDPTPEQARQMLDVITTNGFCTGATPITVPASTSAPTTTTAPPTTAPPATTAPPPPPTDPPAQSVYYPNCTAAREAGAAPINQGEPGYRPELDGNSDGVACEVD